MENINLLIPVQTLLQTMTLMTILMMMKMMMTQPSLELLVPDCNVSVGHCVALAVIVVDVKNLVRTVVHVVEVEF